MKTSISNHQKARRKKGFNKIMQARKAYLESGTSVEDAFRESKDQLEKRPLQQDHENNRQKED